MLEQFRHENCGMERNNKSHLFLLPKRQGADRVEDFCPIYLSNSIYLIIVKVLVNRLREVIDELVGPFRSAYTPRRQLVDSAVMAGEIVAAWRQKATRGFIWKVKFVKAYNYLDWAFLWSSIRQRGFPTKWISWIQRCITSHSFSILVNGRAVGVRFNCKGE